MAKHKLNESGFHLFVILLVLVVIGVVGFTGYKVLSRPAPADTANAPSMNKAEPVRWAFNEKTLAWYAKNGTPPRCKDPFTFDRTPLDLSQVMTIGMPGAYRGYSYKPHGGFRLTSPSSGKIDVVMPTDATLVSLTRYYEGSWPDLQYLLTFETDCGIAFRFDHLHTLSPAFQKIAETAPEPKRDDTRTDPNAPFARTAFKAGDLVATEVGFPSTKNFGFDFGTYDYRQRNTISKNAAWAALHNQYQSLEWYATCWIDMLPGADAAKAKELAFVVINPAKPNIISDYCTYAPHRTLEFNGGKPTDG